MIVHSSQYPLEAADGPQLNELEHREQQWLIKPLKVGDIVIYDPVVGFYLVDNHEIIGKVGIVLDMNPAMTDIRVLVASRYFWCYVGDLRRPE